MLRSNPRSKQYATALELFQSGELQESAKVCYEVLTEDPDDPEALHLWAALEARAGRVDSSIGFLQKVIQLRPSRPRFHNSLGAAFAQKKDLGPAIHHFNQALALEPYYLAAMRNLLRALTELGYPEEIRRVTERIAAIAPETVDQPDILYRVGRRFYDAAEYREAIDWFRRLTKVQPEYVDGHKLLADSLTNERRIDEAIEVYAELAEKSPEDSEPVRNLGLLLQRKGKPEEAVECYRKAIATRPEYAAAYLPLTECRTFDAGDAEIEPMKTLCDDESIDPEDRAIMHFAVGKVYMDLDDPDQAFDYFQRGNTLKRERATYSAAATSEHVDRLIAFFDSDRFEQIGTDFASLCRLPIFIVGMPRSGTTLVEQIIASHPVVSSAGELNDLRRVSERLSLVTKSDDDFPECIAGLEPRNARRLAAGYIERLTSLAPDAQRVIDKMPWNFHALGMIAMFWPRAKIIYCVRDAVDTCVSCYTRYFQAGQPFSWDLAELGHYYRQQQRLADHWREVLPIPILEVPYEQMVAEQEEMSRKLIDFCGLEWDNRCLEFHKTDRVIKTNPLGVRRPVYRTSIGRAEKFGAHLDPLRQALAGDLQPSS